MSFKELYLRPKRLETWLLYLLTASFLIVAFSTQATIWKLDQDWTAKGILRWFHYHDLTGNMLLGLASYGAILLAVESYRASKDAAKDSEKAQQEMIKANHETVMHVKDLTIVMKEQWYNSIKGQINDACAVYMRGNTEREIAVYFSTQKAKFLEIIEQSGKEIKSKEQLISILNDLELDNYIRRRVGHPNNIGSLRAGPLSYYPSVTFHILASIFDIDTSLTTNSIKIINDYIESVLRQMKDDHEAQS